MTAPGDRRPPPGPLHNRSAAAATPARQIALFKLSDADNAFVRSNGFQHDEAWQAWPSDAQLSIPTVEVRESAGEAGTFVYTTPHFRFRATVNLGTSLMKDLARVFELTYQPAHA